MENELKFLQVREATHTQIKEQAKECNMSIREYVQVIADFYKKNARK